MPEQQEPPRPHGDPLEEEVGRQAEEREEKDAPAAEEAGEDGPGQVRDGRVRGSRR